MAWGIDATDISTQIAQASSCIMKTGDRMSGNLAKAIERSCMLVETSAKQDMTPGSYDGPFDGPPHVKTGLLRGSITHYLDSEEGNPIGYVGTNIEYGKYLELGTSKMRPHPFLTPALEKNRSQIISTIKAALASKGASNA